MDKMAMLKDKILEEIMNDMDEHESGKLMPKHPEAMAIEVKADPKSSIPYGDKKDMGEMPEGDMQESGANEDDEDDEDLKRLMEEYSRS